MGRKQPPGARDAGWLRRSPRLREIGRLLARGRTLGMGCCRGCHAFPPRIAAAALRGPPLRWERPRQPHPAPSRRHRTPSGAGAPDDRRLPVGRRSAVVGGPGCERVRSGTRLVPGASDRCAPEVDVFRGAARARSVSGTRIRTPPDSAGPTGRPPRRPGSTPVVCSSRAPPRPWTRQHARVGARQTRRSSPRRASPWRRRRGRTTVFRKSRVCSAARPV